MQIKIWSLFFCVLGSVQSISQAFLLKLHSNLTRQSDVLIYVYFFSPQKKGIGNLPQVIQLVKWACLDPKADEF